MGDLLDQAERFTRKFTKPDKKKKRPKNFDKPTCTKSGKVKYTTAKAVLNAINQRDSSMRYYKCKSCRTYHMTST